MGSTIGGEPSLHLTWARFLGVLEESCDHDAVLQFECRGAFLTFRSRLVRVERPPAFSVETMSRFGVVPHHVTLTFANGVRLNLYMKHIENVTRRGEGVVVTFRGEGRCVNSVAFLPPEGCRKRFTC